MPIQIKRVYEPASPEDGYRVLIDRLWPRGVSRSAEVDDWIKELSPSAELRQWFGHDQRPRLTALRRRARDGTLTLVYSAHDTRHNDAVVLAQTLRRGLPKTRR